MHDRNIQHGEKDNFFVDNDIHSACLISKATKTINACKYREYNIHFSIVNAANNIMTENLNQFNEKEFAWKDIVIRKGESLP